MECNDSYLIHSKIADNWVKLQDVPYDMHLFCPKVNDDDDEDYDDLTSTESESLSIQEKQKRSADAKARLEAVAWCSMVIAILEENSKEILDQFIQRANHFLTKCDRCVQYWHSFRKPFRAMVMRYSIPLILMLSRKY